MTTRMMTRIALVAVCGSLTAWGLTEQWRHVARAPVQQIVGDGKGGCAFVTRETNAFVSVVWLDKKGQLRYDSGPMETVPIGPVINDCTPKQVVYTGTAGFPMMVQVDKNGSPTPVVSFGGYLIGMTIVAPYGHSRLGDKKGFFVLNVNTNTGVNTVVRYLYK